MQQINLYQPILRKQKKVFSASTLLLGNLIILAGLLALYGYTYLQTHTLQHQYEQASSQRGERQQQLQRLRAQYPTPVADASLPQQLEQTRAQLRQQQNLLQAMRRYDSQPELRFSAQLHGLSRQVRGSIWLTRIELQPGQVQLRGKTRDAEQVPRLVQALRQEAAFTGLVFQQVVISRDEDGRLLEFTLNSQRVSEVPARAGGR